MNQHERTCYETDASRLIGKAEKVVFPKSIEDVKKFVVGFDNIVGRGAGTGFVGGTIPSASVVIDMGKMNLVSNFNSSRRSVRVEAGITVKELNEKLNAIGYEFPIYPSNGGISTIGGMIATNASGDRSMKYGLMKDWVDEIEFVNGKGEFVKTSKADVMDVCGMEGITGIIVGATLRVIPWISRSISVFQSDNLDEILSVGRRLKQEKDTCMIAFFSKETSKMLGFPESYNIIIEFDSLRGKIQGEEYEKLKNIKEKAYYALFSEKYYNSEDPKLFFDTIKEFVLFLEKENIPYFGDLGTGVIHPFFKDVEKAKRNLVSELIKKMKAKGGRYGYGLTRKSFLDSFEARLIQRVKQRQDPKGKFNIGKVIGNVNVDVYKEKEPLKVEAEKQEIERAERHVEKVGDEDADKKKKFEIIEEARKELDSKGMKSPDEKLHEFIKEIEVMDRVERKGNENEIRKGLADIEKELVKEEIKVQLKDYKETFESELAPEKVKQVEEIARQIPKKPSVDYNLISSIMTNRAGGKVGVTDNLERPSETPGSSFSKDEDSKKAEKDLINNIMNNKYKKEEKKIEDNNKNHGGNNQ